MDYVYFWQHVGIVIGGNLLTGLIVAFFVNAHLNERRGIEGWRQPMVISFGAAIAFGIVAWSASTIQTGKRDDAEAPPQLAAPAPAAALAQAAQE